MSRVNLTKVEKMMTKVNQIDGWLKTNEILTLNYLAKKALLELKQDEFLLEIGSYKGKSTTAIALACKERKKGVLLAIDPHKKEYFNNMPNTGNTLLELKKNLAKNGILNYVKIIKMDSKKAYKKWGGCKTKLIFIDGDHNYKAAYKDFEHWLTTLQQNGYLLFHDALDIYGPRQIVTRLLTNKEYVFLGLVGNLASFQKKRPNLKNWVKKIYSLVILKLFFFKTYTPYNS